jgi:pimeloyl-ACP methyl ester carboxylesterase
MSLFAVNGTRLHVEWEGAGPPLVLVHGLGDESGQWAPVVAALAGEFTVVRYDLRAHGLSAGASAADVPLDTHRADLAALLDALALGPVHLAGHDLGGEVAQSLAYVSPDRVRSLVLEATLPAPPAEAPPSLAIDTRVAGEHEPLTERDPMSASLTRSDQFRRLGAIDSPTLVLVGELDDPWFQRGAELLHGWIPNSRLVRIADAGHAPHVEQPARFLAHLRAFLDEFSPRP